jgi:hypothetical protein
LPHEWLGRYRFLSNFRLGLEGLLSLGLGLGTLFNRRWCISGPSREVFFERTVDFSGDFHLPLGPTPSNERWVHARQDLGERERHHHPVHVGVLGEHRRERMPDITVGKFDYTVGELSENLFQWHQDAGVPHVGLTDTGLKLQRHIGQNGLQRHLYGLPVLIMPIVMALNGLRRYRRARSGILRGQFLGRTEIVFNAFGARPGQDFLQESEHRVQMVAAFNWCRVDAGNIRATCRLPNVGRQNLWRFVS